MKAAGFEPVEVRSGYNGNDAWARTWSCATSGCASSCAARPRGQPIAYRLRAEIPGKFSPLPAKASGVYAPELKANSDEIKLNIVDAPVKK